MNNRLFFCFPSLKYLGILKSVMYGVDLCIILDLWIKVSVEQMHSLSVQFLSLFLYRADDFFLKVSFIIICA